MNSTDTNYDLHEHEDVDQYGSIAIPSEIMPYQSYPECLANKDEILTGLSHKRAHLALIMSLTSMRNLTNMTHMQYQPC